MLGNQGGVIAYVVQILRPTCLVFKTTPRCWKFRMVIMVRWVRPLSWLSILLSCAHLTAAGNCPDGSTVTIKSQEDANEFKTCRTFKGDIVISKDAIGDIALEGPVNIVGKVYTNSNSSEESSGLLAFSTDTIETITGDLEISSLGGLKNVSLTNLRTVGGALRLNNLPMLTGLHLEGINSVASFHLISTPNLLNANIGSQVVRNDPEVGLKHITSETTPIIEIKNVGLNDLTGLMDVWNASMFILEDVPNLDHTILITDHVQEMRIHGNGNLTLEMWERLLDGFNQPVIETLNITGVKHISPCLWPDVYEFIAINNTVEYLHFGFKNVQRLEIRDNPYMKTLVPFNGQNLWEWNLTDILIKDNPLLTLERHPPRAKDDNLTVLECPFMFNHSTDAWEWYPFHMNTIVVNASVQDNFFQSFIDLWGQTTFKVDNTVPAVFREFNVTSTDLSFSCSQLDRLRTITGAFPGEYSCQGHSLPPEAMGKDSAAALITVVNALTTVSDNIFTTIAMSDFMKFVRTQYANLPVPKAPANIADATYVVTGANTGLGLECVKHLFRMGTGRVILAVRSREKGEAGSSAVRIETNSNSVGEVWELDLASFDSVEAFAKRLNSLERLDALIANAGVVMTKYQEIKGMELSLVVNVVSTLLLSLRALPKLQATARSFGVQPRLVVVSSNAALASDMKRAVEKLQGNVFDALSVEKGYSAFVQYPKTKLLEIYTVRQLAALLPLSDSGVIINAVSPGLCYSELDRNGAFAQRLAMAAMRKVLARTAEEGSRNIVTAAFSGPESHGSYCSECQVKDQALPSWITDEAGQRTQARVWRDLIKKLEDIGHGADIITP
ncbi:hypothetical protein G7046_g6152 [Stylonectria norvegica]|nr:hypothetical protein G7046_g6152 [Stylonectria norvegica]